MLYISNSWYWHWFMNFYMLCISKCCTGLHIFEFADEFHGWFLSVVVGDVCGVLCTIQSSNLKPFIKP